MSFICAFNYNKAVKKYKKRRTSDFLEAFTSPFLFKIHKGQIEFKCLINRFVLNFDVVM